MKHGRNISLGLFIALVTIVIVGCASPVDNSSRSPGTNSSGAVGSGVLQAGTTPRINKAGDDYKYAISGYYTKTGQTAQLGTLGGVAEAYFTLDPTKGPNILKVTMVMTITTSDGQSSTSTTSNWYTSAGEPYWDNTNGKVTAIVGTPPTVASANASWVRSYTYSNGVTETNTYRIAGAYDVECPYGLVKGAWKTQVTSSKGSVSYSWEAPSIGASVKVLVASGNSSVTMYPTLLLESYILAP